MVARPPDPGSNDAVAIVTGGSCPPGRDVARRLAGEGYAVVVVYLRERDEADAAVEEILATGGTAVAVRADIADELDAERLFAEAAAAFGGVDVVVHTAMRETAVVNRQAARRLRRGGAIIDLSSSEGIDLALADELRARDISVNGVPPGLEPPGARHGVGDLIGLLDRWRRSPG